MTNRGKIKDELHKLLDIHEDYLQYQNWLDSKEFRPTKHQEIKRTEERDRVISQIDLIIKYVSGE